MKLDTYIDITYNYTNKVKEAEDWLNLLPNTFAADFEVANKYTKEEKEEFKRIMETSNNKLEVIEAMSKYNSDPLGHPSHNKITHFSFSSKSDEGKVLIIDNDEILEFLLDFLITTDKKQVWHNASYDFKYIYYYKKQFPKDYEDTQILAKTLVNHVETSKAKTGLKYLAGHMYGDWGISSDNFTLDQMYEDHVIKYAATDAAATIWLWNEINKNLKG